MVVKEGNVTISGPRFVQDSAQCVRVRRRKRFKPLFEPPISRAMAYDRTTGHVPAQGAPEALQLLHVGPKQGRWAMASLQQIPHEQQLLDDIYRVSSVARWKTVRFGHTIPPLPRSQCSNWNTNGRGESSNAQLGGVAHSY